MDLLRRRFRLVGASVLSASAGATGALTALGALLDGTPLYTPFGDTPFGDTPFGDTPFGAAGWMACDDEPFPFVAVVPLAL